MELENRLDHFCGLDVDKPVSPIALTGMICTIGPSSRNPDILEKMMEAGMTIARLNLAYDTHEYHAETISNIRTALKNYSERIGMPYSLGIGVDTRGPEIRIGSVDRGGASQILLKRGESFKLTTDIEYAEKGTNKIIYVNYENISKFVSRGTRLYINNGLIALICIGTATSYINCVIEIGGWLPRYADVKIPGVALDLPDVSDQDKIDLSFAVEQGVDIIFASFVRNVFGPVETRNILGRENEHIQIISKIENLQGVRNIQEIINASDGIMIVHNILALEVPPEKIFLVQKFISSNCTIIGKPVICATQTLEWMMKRNEPSRSEIFDVASAIVDGMDCVLLTDETAIGENPVCCINHMIVICKEAEAVIWRKEIALTVRKKVKHPTDITHGIALSAVEAVERSHAKAIVALTTKARSAKLISKYKPDCPIIVVTRNKDIVAGCLLYRSILPLYFTDPELDNWLDDVDVRLNYAVKYAVKKGFVKPTDMIIALTSWKKGFHFTSTLRYLFAADILNLV